MENKSYSGTSAAADETLRRSHHLSEQLADITAKVLRFTNAGGAAIAIGAGDVAVTKAASGDLAPDLETPIRLEGSFAGLCIREGELLYCEDAENDPRVDAATSAAMGLRSMVMVPIGERTNICGVLAAFSGTPGAFRPTHIAVLRTLADIVHELIVREEQTKASETQSVRRYEPPVATPPPAPAYNAEPTIPVRPEAPAPMMSAAPAFHPEPPVIAPVVERVQESAKVIEIPRPIQTPFNVPTVAPDVEPRRPEANFAPVVESLKPVETPKVYEAPKAVEVPVPVEPPKFVDSSKKDKDALPSFISLTNQAKRAEATAEVVDANVLPAAADPLTKPFASTSSGAAVKPAPSPKQKQRKKETLPVPQKSTPVENVDNAAMFRGLEHSAPESNPALKYAGIAVLGLVVLSGTVWGVRSFIRRPAAQPAPVVQVPAAGVEAPAQPSTADLTLSTAPANGAQKPGGAATPATAQSKSESEPKTEAKSETTKAVIVSNKVAAMPHHAAQGDMDAPQIALSGGSGNLGALMTGKSATPTLNVKRSSLSPPDVIHRVPPKFPEFARRSNPAGDRVVLNVTVGKDGRVGNIQVVRGQPMFSDAAVNAVKQWQYRPAFLNGDPVEATVEVVISFTNGR
jgi:TonB family protein